MLATRIHDVYSVTIAYQRTHEAHWNEMMRLVWETPECKSLPAYMREYLRAVDYTLMRQLYAPIGQPETALLEWVLIDSTGKQYRKVNDEWLQLSEDEKSNMCNQSTHAWVRGMNEGKLNRW